MIEQHLTTDGIKVRYFEAGAGDAVIVLHGGQGLAWTAVHDQLAKSHRVIAPEIPGFGIATDGARSMRERARTIVSFAAKLGIERWRIVSVGLSARLALWAAMDAPERIESIAMVTPAAIRPDDWKPPPGAPAHLVDLIGPNRDLELEARFGEIKLPVLVIFGTRDDVVAPAMGRIYRERIPNCYFMMVYDAGHRIADERPDALARLLADFLERGDAFIVNRASGLINP